MKKAVIFGAGSIGRGFMGQIFNESGYEITFIEIDEEINNQLNQRHSYPLQIVSPEKSRKLKIDQVKAVSPLDKEKVSKEIKEADIMATAVGVDILPQLVETLISGFRKRWQQENTKPLNIIICENKIDADKYLRNLIIENLKEEEIRYFDRSIGLVKASVGRMVPEITEEMKKEDPLQIIVEPYKKLPVDKFGFKGKIPDIENMIPYSPFEFYIQRKLFMHNMAHAVTAYTAYINNYSYIWEAVKNSDIKLIIKTALQEAARALAKEHEENLDDLLVYSDNLIYRFNNKALGDTVKRVGRDPVRKLSAEDRLIGIARLGLQKGVIPVFILVGAAAALFFNPKGDKSAGILQKKLKEKEVKEVLKDISSLNEEKNDKIIIKNIYQFYNMFKKDKELSSVINQADILKQKNI